MRQIATLKLKLRRETGLLNTSLGEENALVLVKVEGVAIEGEVRVAAVLAVRRHSHGDADGVVDCAELGARDGDTSTLIEFCAEYPSKKNVL